MKPTQFIKDHGLERARDILEQREKYIHVEKPTHFDTDLKIFFHKDDVIELDESDIDLSGLKRLVESVDLVNSFGGLKAAKRKVKMALFNGFLLISFPVDSGIGSIYTYKVELAIKDYESIYGEGNE
jgi:hypothetical protein